MRFINNKDIIPRVPLRLAGYVDVGTVVHFDLLGKPSLEASEWRNYLDTPFQSLAQVLEMSTHFQVDLGDHSRFGYQTLIEQNQGPLAPLLKQIAG